MTRTNRALLTKKQREFLPKQSEYHEGKTNPRQRRSDTRTAIRGRLEDTLKDFTLLFDHLRIEDRNKLFGGKDRIEDPDIWRSARDTIAFLLRQTGAGYKIRSHPMPEAEMDQLLVEAFQRVANEFPGNYTVTGLQLDEDSLQVERVNIDAAIEKLQAGEELTLAQKQALLNSGRARLELNPTNK